VLVFRVDDFATDAIAAWVGAMDVSEKRSAAEFGANVIARGDDRATTKDVNVERSRGDGCERKTERSGVLART
jgi:hypothetical protein